MYDEFYSRVINEACEAGIDSYSIYDFEYIEEKLKEMDIRDKWERVFILSYVHDMCIKLREMDEKATDKEAFEMIAIALSAFRHTMEKIVASISARGSTIKT